MTAVIHGLISGVLPARCQREAGACGAGAAGSESQPYLEGGIEAVDLFWGAVGRSPMPADWVWGGPWDTVLTGLVSTGLSLTGAWADEGLRPVG